MTLNFKSKSAIPIHICTIGSGLIAGAHGVRIHSERAFGKHSHDSFGFGIMDAGGQTSSSGRGSVKALAGQIITTNPGEVHDGVPLRQHARSWRMAYVTPRLMAAMVGQPNVEFTQPVLDDALLHRTFDMLFRQWDMAAIAGETGVLEASLAHSCGLLVHHYASKSLVSERYTAFGRIRECLKDQLDAPPTLAALAALAGLSRYQLVRQFYQVHRLTPFAWLLQYRLNRAQELIANGIPLLEAALSSGFSDQSHLTRAFARYRGFTPGAWQRAQ